MGYKQLFGSFKGLFKYNDDFQYKTTIDNLVFSLHYQLTVSFLFGFAILVAANQYFGNSIYCTEGDGIPNEFSDAYCWIHATFTTPEAASKEVGIEVPHPGIDTFTAGEKRIYHKYYQWVWLVLSIQAMLFYVPRHLWNLWEGKRMSSLVSKLNQIILDRQPRTEMIQLLLVYFKSNFGYHNYYFAYFVACEVLNFVNVVGQMYLMDAFLGYAFSTYGLDVLQYTYAMDQESRVDPMVAVFPRIGKCTFHRFGSSGDITKVDLLCLLPLNIVNEKIYIFLWFWFAFLAFASGAILLYRILTLFCEPLRKAIFHWRASYCPRRHVPHLNIILKRVKIGDWFLLNLLAENMEVQNFSEFIEQLSDYLAKGEESGKRKTGEKRETDEKPEADDKSDNTNLLHED